MMPNQEHFELLQATETELNGSTQKRRYYHHHEFRREQQSQLATVDHDPEGIHQQLLRSVSLVLEIIGFGGATPDALESLAIQVETFLSHFLGYVKASMATSRRLQPIPRDFEFALTQHRFTCRSLLPHLDPPIAPEQCSLSLYSELAAHNKDEELMALFHATLHDYTQPKLSYAPRGLPLLPSQHTYKATLSYIPRERDPKKIRELATEEARMGEEALRRLVTGTSQSKSNRGERLLLTSRQKQRKLWQQTMEAMAAENTGDAELVDDSMFKMDLTGAPINADKVFWRQPITTHEQEATEL